MNRALVGLAGLVVASLVAGCGDGPPPTPQVVFFTSDRTTSAQVAAIRIISADGVVPTEVIDTVAANIRVATWPGDVEVPTIQTILTGIAAAPENMVVPGGIVMIDRQLDPSLDPSAWYAISLPPSAAYSLPTLFAFDGGVRGSRFSPAHAPVVAWFMSCPRNGGGVTVEAWYSERVVHAAGVMPALDYGAPPVSCALGFDGITATQFICPGTGDGEPFSLRIPDGVMAQDSKRAMAPGSIDSTGMQTTPANGGCTLHLPVTAD